ncbi:MAG: cupin domain-containing protein [Candidatus Omnitrophica bacterium]|nr:cupin domain-containing protein [Candidatus Omnitrophota bacterium]
MKKKTEALMGKKINMHTLLDYQRNCVVSQEVIKKTTGTVTLFAFDEGQGLSEHIAPFDALVYILDGSAKITVSKKVFNLKAGQMIIMPQGAPHSLKAIAKFKMLLIMIRS